MKNDYTKDERNIKYFAIAISIIVITLWGLTWTLTDLFFCKLDEKGTFGDMFGTVNALFSGLAFVGVIVAILLQRVELKLQREELVQTREELRGQKEQLEKQNETMQLQKFENSFFQMLSFHHKLLEGTTFTQGDRSIVNGSNAIRIKYKAFANTSLPFELDFNGLFMKHVEKSTSKFGHYFRNLYHIVKFIDEDEIEDKNKYIGILRAQLSNYEQAFLFYNCLTSKGSGFKPLVEKFSLLENMNYELLIDFRDIRQYDLKAFGDDELPINTSPPS